MEAPAPGESPQVVVGSSGAALPTETTHQGERALETAREILEHIHTIHLQTMHEMGSVRELEWTLVCTLMAEFVRLQLIIGEDLAKSLIALRSDLETSCEALSSDFARTLNLHSDDPVFPQVKELIQKFQQFDSIKVNLPLMELGAAREDIEGFLQRCLCEISSQSESQEMTEELSWTLSAHASRIWEVIQAPRLHEPAVFQRVMVGLAMDQPLEAIFFPGILGGLTGRLGLMPPGVVDPPTSARAGMSQWWAVALREAVMRNEGRDIDLEQATPNVVHPGLHLDYDLDCWTWRVDDIAPTLTSPLLSGLVSNICLLGRPVIPNKPVSPKVEEGLWGRSRAPARPDAPGPSCDGGLVPLVGKVEAKENKPCEQGEGDLDQTLLEPDPEEVAAIIISDDNEADLPIDMPWATSMPKSEPALSQKRPLEDRSPHMSPPKKWATEEEERSMPPHEAVLPRGVTEEDILPKRYETFTSDNDWVQCMRCSLLGLETETTPSRKDIDTSDCFVPWVAASELDLPEVITDHWLPILWEEVLLVESSPDQFTTMADWVPLYTQEGLERYLPAALSSFASTGVPWLTAVVPPECRVGTDKEFLLSNFHWHGCLMRQSLNFGGRHRQLAFCPYCGVINENSDTALSHMRKHLDLHFVCGGCYSKSFLNGPALHKHMRTQCPSLTAIRDQSRTSRR